MMRILNRFLALAMALAISAVAVGVAAESVAALIDQGPAWLPLSDWDDWVSARQWSDDSVVAIAAAMVAIGLGLLITQSWPRRPRRLALAADDSDSLGSRRCSINRRSLEGHLEEVIRRDTPALDARARAGRRRVRIQAHAPATATETKAISAAVRAAVSDEFDSIDLRRRPRLRVRVERAKKRVG